MAVAHPASMRPGPGRGPMRVATLLGIIAGSVAASAYFTSTSGFYGDDFINFREAQLEHGLSPRFLISPTSAHFAPGHRLGDWLLYTFAPLNFPVAQAVLLVGFAASLLVFHLVLSELFETRPALVLTFLYGASTVHVAVHEWWASGLDRVPATFLTFVSILGYLRFHRTGSRRWLAVSVGALGVALLFYVKPILVPVYLILIRVLLRRPDEPIRVSLRAVWREWRVWTLYLLPVALFSAVYSRAYDAGGQVRSPTPEMLGRYLANLWFRVVAPGFFGVYVPQTDDSTLAVTVFALVQLVVVAAVVWSVARRRAALRAWLFLAITISANALIVGLTRIGPFTPRYVAYELMYNLEIEFLAVLGAGFAVSLSRRSPASSASSASSASPVRQAPTAPTTTSAVAALALASYLGFTWWGSHRISQPDVWPGGTARAYVERVDAFLKSASRQGVRPAFVDGSVPQPVMHPLAGPWTSHSELFPVIDDRVSFEVGGRALFEAGDDGTPRPVSFVSDAGGDMASLVRLGVIGVDGARAQMRDGALCVRSGKKAESVTMQVPAGAGGDRPHVLLHHSSSRRFVSAFLTEPLGGGPLSPPRYTMAKGAGAEHQNIFAVPAGPLQRLFIVVGPHADMCLSRIEVGRLVVRG